MSEPDAPLTPEEPQADAQRYLELETELRELRAVVRRLKAENERLLRAMVDRDYERPPHYL